MFKNSFQLYIQEFKLIAILSCSQVGLEFLSEILDSNSGFLFAEVLLWAYLAMAVHVRILLPENRSKKEIFNQVFGFAMRTLGLGIVAFLPMLTYVFYFTATTNVHPFGSLEFLGVITLTAIVGFCVVFALFGTLLPAFVYEQAQGVSAAFQRGKTRFVYLFTRLLIGPSLVSVIVVILTISMVAVFSFKNLLPTNEIFGVNIVFAVVIFFTSFIQAYATVMLAWILSNAYKDDIKLTATID